MKEIIKEPSGKEFTDLITRRRFIRTFVYRHPQYKENYEIYSRACIVDKAQFCHEALKAYIVKPKYPGDPER